MPMDDRKQRILMAVVSLYAAEGEPVGSNLLSRYFNLSVSSATLRNEMAMLTKLGLLEQPHTSAGRVPTAKGYRYYVDHLLGIPAGISPQDKEQIDDAFYQLDYDPDKLAQGAAKSLSDLIGLSVVATTPRAEDMKIAHFEVLQVGRYSAAVLAVTSAGGVRTRVAKVEFELNDGDTECMAATLNRYLRFVSEADVNSALVQAMLDDMDHLAQRCWPVISAGLTLLSEAGVPSVYFEGQKYLLNWPELEPSLHTIMELISQEERLESLIRPTGNHTTVILGDELLPKPIPGLCFVSRRYLAGGGLAGTIGVVGPARMRFREVIPKLEYCSVLLGHGMSGSVPYI